MNESIEREGEDMAVVMTQPEQDVVVETPTAAPAEDAGSESPFGSAPTVIEEQAVRELAPILDLPVEEVPVMAEEQAEVVTAEEAPTEDYEIPMMASPEVVESAPVEAPVETPTDMGMEPSIYDDPMFGPIKRVLMDIMGEG